MLTLGGSGSLARLDRSRAATLEQGTVYVFTGATTSWAQQAELTVSQTGTHAPFGEFVAASSTNAMVGEPSHDVGALNGAGLVDVFASS